LAALSGAAASLAALGLILTSGVGTGALWIDSAEAKGVTIKAGDLDLRKCPGVSPSYSDNGLDESGSPAPSVGSDLSDLRDYPGMPGDVLTITQCVETHLDGDNLAVRFRVDWDLITAGFGDYDAYADFLTDHGIDATSTTYKVVPVVGQAAAPIGVPTVDSSGWSTTTTAPVGQGGVVIGIEPATDERGAPPGLAPATPDDRWVQWDVVITITFLPLAPSYPEASPSILPPTAVPVSSTPQTTPSRVGFPGLVLSAEQTRTTGQGF
jgi:alternate signal-mediated exported protein